MMSHISRHTSIARLSTLYSTSVIYWMVVAPSHLLYKDALSSVGASAKIEFSAPMPVRMSSRMGN